MIASSTTKWPAATRERPCPQCGHANRCRVAPDGLAGICWRSGSADVWRDGGGNGNGHGTGYIGAAHRPKPTPKPAATYATADDAIAAAGRSIPGATLTTTWVYPGDVMRVARFDAADSKQFRPVHRIDTSWRIGDPRGPLPLYRWDEIPAAGPVYVVEGEKCCDAARSIGLGCVTSAHGSNAAGKTDWTPLAGRDCIILPDHDDAGRKYAADVARIIEELSPPGRAKTVALPGLADGGDIADYIDARDSQESEDIRACIERLADAVPFAGLGDAVVPAGTLIADYPHLREPVIEGLLRRTETANLISASKIGKTFLVHQLALSVATGRMFLTFSTRAGRVLIVDDELHVETIARRLRDVAGAMGVMVDDIADRIDVLPLRGRLKSIDDLRPDFRRAAGRGYSLIIIDSLYRLIGARDENANGDITAVYGFIDYYAEQTGAGIVCVHHSSKGGQAGRYVTDVGAGAGVQSRAVDSHLIIRPHSEDGCAVMDGVLRSWPPMKPLGIRREHPLWHADTGIDVSDLREPGQKRKAEDAPAEAWTAERFVEQFVIAKPRTLNAISVSAEAAGLSSRRARALLDAAVEASLCHEWAYTDRRQKHRFSTEPQTLGDTGHGPSGT